MIQKHLLYIVHKVLIFQHCLYLYLEAISTTYLEFPLCIILYCTLYNLCFAVHIFLVNLSKCKTFIKMHELCNGIQGSLMFIVIQILSSDQLRTVLFYV